MYVRLRLDIGWRDLVGAAGALLAAGDRDRRQRRIETRAGPAGDVLCCLSVRSALDLYLGAASFPVGSEVLMTAVNVPDMARIVERHGLVPVPVDIDPATLGPSPGAIARAASPRTVAIVVAHLFGSRVALDETAGAARRNGWLLLEDCAQAFAGTADLGDPRADAAFFSFGPIKTATALAGALVKVRDAAIMGRMREAQSRHPVQRRLAYAARIVRFALLKCLSWPPLYGAFVKLLRALGRDHDAFVQGSARAFPRADLLAQIRHRPSAPLLALLERRLRRASAPRIGRRAEIGRELLRRLPSRLHAPGTDALSHTHWVFPVLAPDPARVVATLRAAGFDATSQATLGVVAAPPDRPDLDPVRARRLLAEIVYLPVYPELPAAARARLLTALAELPS